MNMGETAFNFFSKLALTKINNKIDENVNIKKNHVNDVENSQYRKTPMII